jgi:hypothetical protein
VLAVVGLLAVQLYAECCMSAHADSQTQGSWAGSAGEHALCAVTVCAGSIGCSQSKSVYCALLR